MKFIKIFLFFLSCFISTDIIRSMPLTKISATQQTELNMPRITSWIHSTGAAISSYIANQFNDTYNAYWKNPVIKNEQGDFCAIKKLSELYASHQTKKPFIATYQNENQTIFYLASEHTTNPHSPVHQAIQKLFNDYHFDHVFIEDYLKRTKLSITKNKFKNNFESILTAHLAHKNNCPLTVADATQEEVLAKLLLPEYESSKEKFIYFDICIKNIMLFLQDQNQNKIFDNTFKNKKSDIKDYFRIMQQQEVFRDTHCSYEDLIAFTQSHYEKTIENICYIRDQVALSVIESTLKNKNIHCALIVYGMDHWATQETILEALYGKPVLIQTCEEFLEKI